MITVSRLCLSASVPVDQLNRVGLARCIPVNVQYDLSFFYLCLSCPPPPLLLDGDSIFLFLIDLGEGRMVTAKEKTIKGMKVLPRQEPSIAIT